MPIQPILSFPSFNSSATPLRALRNSQARLSLLYSQLVTGNRLVHPSIDPGAFVAQQALRTELSGTIAARGAIELGRAAMHPADTTLGSVTDERIDLCSLAVQSLGTNDNDARRALQTQAD